MHKLPAQWSETRFGKEVCWAVVQVASGQSWSLRQQSHPPIRMLQDLHILLLRPIKALGYR